MKYELDGRYLNIAIDTLFTETIQDFFDAYIPSKKIQHLLIQNKWILMDGNPVKRESEIEGVNLNINIYPEEYEYRKLDKDNLNIIYEDELFLIVNKPKGVLVHSDGVSEEITLKQMVESYYFDRNHISAIPIHRLDKETTGLVIFSKSIIFQPLLDKLLNEKQIRRSYLAFVFGTMKEGEVLNINKPIGKDRHNANKRVIAKNGQSALTKVRSLGTNLKKNYSVLRCNLDTGRTHQIRVHLASIKHAILNDELYGGKSDLCIRMGLLADNLDFYHPLKEEFQYVECALPKDLEKLFQDVNC